MIFCPDGIIPGPNNTYIYIYKSLFKTEDLSFLSFYNVFFNFYCYFFVSGLID